MVVPEAVSVGAVGGVVSAKVVTFTVLLFTDTFPAASFAFTVKEYEVDGSNPVTLKVVAVVVLPIKTPAR